MILLRIPFYILFIALFWTIGTYFGMFVGGLIDSFPLFVFFATILYFAFIFACPIVNVAWFESEYGDCIDIDIKCLFGKIKKYITIFIKKG